MTDLDETIGHVKWWKGGERHDCRGSLCSLPVCQYALSFESNRTGEGRKVRNQSQRILLAFFDFNLLMQPVRATCVWLNLSRIFGHLQCLLPLWRLTVKPGTLAAWNDPKRHLRRFGYFHAQNSWQGLNAEALAGSEGVVTGKLPLAVLKCWNVWKGSVKYESRRLPVLCLHSFRCRMLVCSIPIILYTLYSFCIALYLWILYWYTVILLSHCIINTAHCIFSASLLRTFAIKTCMFRCRAVRWCRAARGEGKREEDGRGQAYRQ